MKQIEELCESLDFSEDDYLRIIAAPHLLLPELPQFLQGLKLAYCKNIGESRTFVTTRSGHVCKPKSLLLVERLQRRFSVTRSWTLLTLSSPPPTHSLFTQVPGSNAGVGEQGVSTTSMQKVKCRVTKRLLEWNCPSGNRHFLLFFLPSAFSLSFPFVCLF